MRRMFFVLTTLFTVSCSSPVVDGASHDSPPSIEEPGVVPSGYIQYCRDFPKALACDEDGQ